VKALEDFGGGVAGWVEEVAEGLVELEREEVSVDVETACCVAGGGRHRDDKVRCGAGAGAEEAEAAGGEAKLANEDGGGWDCWLGDEGGEEIGDDGVDVGSEGAIPFFPGGVGVVEREVVENIGGEEVWEFLDEAL